VKKIPEPANTRQIIKENSIFLRALSCVVGLAVLAAGIVFALLFISNELQESLSAPQWGVRHPMLLAAIAVVIGLGFAVLCGYLAFRLIRFAIRRPKSG
jgi:multisubunit Na+/H+ antiporter MnhB subunit